MISFLHLNALFKGATVIGLFGLFAAFSAQYIFNIPPCILCLFERIPYALSFGAGLIGWRYSKIFPRSLVFFLFCTFLMGSIISFYHTGIERGVFPSTEACGGSSSSAQFYTVEDLEASLTETPIVRCDEVKIRLLGISLAEYNFLFSFFITIFLGWIFFQIFTRRN